MVRVLLTIWCFFVVIKVVSVSAQEKIPKLETYGPNVDFSKQEELRQIIQDKGLQGTGENALKILLGNSWFPKFLPPPIPNTGIKSNQSEQLSASKWFNLNRPIRSMNKKRKKKTKFLTGKPRKKKHSRKSVESSADLDFDDENEESIILHRPGSHKLKIIFTDDKDHVDMVHPGLQKVAPDSIHDYNEKEKGEPLKSKPVKGVSYNVGGYELKCLGIKSLKGEDAEGDGISENHNIGVRSLSTQTPLTTTSNDSFNYLKSIISQENDYDDEAINLLRYTDLKNGKLKIVDGIDPHLQLNAPISNDHNVTAKSPTENENQTSFQILTSNGRLKKDMKHQTSDFKSSCNNTDSKSFCNDKNVPKYSSHISRSGDVVASTCSSKLKAPSQKFCVLDSEHTLRVHIPRTSVCPACYVGRKGRNMSGGKKFEDVTPLVPTPTINCEDIPCHPVGPGPLYRTAKPEPDCEEEKHDKEYEDALTGKLADRIVEVVMAKVEKSPRMQKELGLCQQSNLTEIEDAVCHPSGREEWEKSSGDQLKKSVMQEIGKAVDRLADARGISPGTCLRPPQHLLDFLAWLLSDNSTTTMPHIPKHQSTDSESFSRFWDYDWNSNSDLGSEQSNSFRRQLRSYPEQRRFKEDGVFSERLWEPSNQYKKLKTRAADLNGIQHKWTELTYY